MKILVSGSHALVGSALIRSLTPASHEVIRLVRHQAHHGRLEIGWDPQRGLIDKEHLEGLDVVIHLAGENIAEGRWTSEKKRAILDSRVTRTRLRSERRATLPPPPAVFECAYA